MFRLDQQFGQTQCIAQAEVEALRAERMHGLRGIADQRHARRSQRIGQLARERIRLALARPTQSSGAIAEALMHEGNEGRIIE